jgi:hypothetical protein
MKKLLLGFALPLALSANVAFGYAITADKYQSSSATTDLKGTTSNGTIGSLYTSVTFRQQLTPGPITAFDAWCIEPLVNDTAGPYNYAVTDLFGSAYLGGNSALQAAIERLWTVAESATGAPTMSTDASLPANWSQLAAAFQISLWELATDGTSWSFDAGNTRLAATGVNAFTDVVRGIASGWLNAAFATDLSGNFTAAQTRLEYLDTPVNNAGLGQDHIRPWRPGSDGNDPLPLPGAAWLALLGLAAVVGFRKSK